MNGNHPGREIVRLLPATAGPALAGLALPALRWLLERLGTGDDRMAADRDPGDNEVPDRNPSEVAALQLLHDEDRYTDDQLDYAFALSMDLALGTLVLCEPPLGD